MSTGGTVKVCHWLRQCFRWRLSGDGFLGQAVDWGRVDVSVAGDRSRWSFRAPPAMGWNVKRAKALAEPVAHDVSPVW